MTENSKSQNVVTLLYFIVGGAVAVLGVGHWVIFPLEDSSLPPKSLDLVILSFSLGGLMVWSSLSSLRRRGVSGVKPGQRLRLLRSQTTLGFGYFYWQVVLVAIALISLDYDGWNLATVRADSKHHPFYCFLVGLGAYFIFGWSLQAFYEWRGTLQRVKVENLAVLAAIWPRQKKQKRFAWVAVCLLNPLTEEFFFRGLLVSQFDTIIGSAYIPILIGLLINCGYHLYQGQMSMVTHIPFYFVSVGLLYSPFGLVACFGLHFAGDYVPVMQMRQMLVDYQGYYRGVHESRSEEFKPPG